MFEERGLSPAVAAGGGEAGHAETGQGRRKPSSGSRQVDELAALEAATAGSGRPSQELPRSGTVPMLPAGPAACSGSAASGR